eukprot:GHVH01009192.1.p1 GENE.GHVH01009192.1~~GHVH01009192.1.p1  ORF type:complete len:1301 (+),score=114.14 GHVH01009192.1:1100-5002(+)
MAFPKARKWSIKAAVVIGSLLLQTTVCLGASEVSYAGSSRSRQLSPRWLASLLDEHTTTRLPKPKIRQLIVTGSACVINPFHYDVMSTGGTNTDDEVVYSLEEDIPTQMTIIGERNTFVCFDEPTSESGCTDSIVSRYFTLSSDTRIVPIYYTGLDRSERYSIQVKLVPRPCELPKLQDITLSSGPLDTPFNPSTYSYFAHINKKELYAYVKIPKSSSTQCGYEIFPSWRRGASGPSRIVDGIYIKLGPTGHADLHITCTGHRGSVVRYIVTLVYQTGEKKLALVDLRPRSPLRFMDAFDSASSSPLHLILQPGSPHYLYLLAETISPTAYVFADKVPFARVAHLPDDKVQTTFLYRSPAITVHAAEKVTLSVRIVEPSANGLDEKEYIVIFERHSRHINSWAASHGMWKMLGIGKLLASMTSTMTVKWTQTLQSLQFTTFSGLFIYPVTHARPEGFDLLAKNLQYFSVMSGTVGPYLVIDYLPGSPSEDADSLVPLVRKLDELEETFDAKESYLEIEDRRLMRVRYYLRMFELLMIVVPCFIFGYSILWFLLIRSHTSLFHTRPDCPKALTPSIAFATLFESTILLSTQVWIGLALDPPGIIFMQTRIHHDEVRLMAIVGLICGPVLGFVLIIGAYSFYVDKKIGFSNMSGTYLPLLITHISPSDGYCRHVPILGRLLEIQIRNAIPIKYSPNEEVCHVPTTDDKVHAPLFRGTITKSEAHDRTPYYDPKTKSVRLYINSSLYYSSKMNVRTSKFYGKYGSASLGVKQFTLYNLYDWPLTVSVDIQLQHVDAITNLFDNYALLVPVRQLDSVPFFNTVSFKQLYEHAPRSAPFYYLVDRGALFLEIVLANCFDLSHASMISVAACELCVGLLLLIPTLQTGSSIWVRWMRHRKRSVDNECRYIAEVQENFQTWPFTDPNLRSRYFKVKEDMEAKKNFGLNRILTISVSWWKWIKNSSFWWTRLWISFLTLANSPAIIHFLRASSIVCLSIWQSHDSSTPAIAFMILSILAWKWQGELAEVWGCLYCFWRSVVKRHHRNTVKCILWIDKGLENHEKQRQLYHRLISSFGQSFVFSHTIPIRKPIAVESVVFCCTEIGIQMEGELSQTNVTRYCHEGYEGHTKVHKHPIVMSNMLFASSRSLPIQIPLKDFFTLHRTRFPLKPVATIQIMNHRTRGLTTGTAQTDLSPHDSILSLYHDPELIPESGTVKLKQEGRGYTIKYSPLKRSIVVRGPEIMADGHYQLTFKHATLTSPDEHDDDTSPRTAAVGVHRSIEVVARTAGRVDVELQHPPHPYRMAKVLL